jgi:hypothetical protein
MMQTTLRVGVFMLLALAVVQCRTANPTPQAAGGKPPIAGKVKKAAPAPATGSTQSNATGAAGSSVDAAKTNLAARLENARLDALDPNYADISLTDCIPGQPDPNKIVCNGKAFHAKVNDAGLRAKLKQFHVGDHVRVDINDNGELKELRGPWSVPIDGISPSCRLLVLAACALGIFGLSTAVTKGSPLKFIVGMDNRYSNSKLQLALWFWVVISTYIATVVFRVRYAGWDFFGGVNIPQNLLMVSGLSVLTYGGAKAITTAKVNAAMNPTPVAVAGGPPGPVAAVVAPPAPAPVAVAVGAMPAAPVAIVTTPSNPDPKAARQPGQENLLRDLVQNDVGGFDFGDFQMVLVTLVAVVMYLMLIFHSLGSVEFLKTTYLPDVDTTILAGFGLGQGAYLAKKAGGNVGTS